MFDPDEDDLAAELLNIPVPIKTPKGTEVIPLPEKTAKKISDTSSKNMTDMILNQVQENNQTLAERYPVVQELNKQKLQAGADSIVAAQMVGDNSQIVLGARLIAEKEAQRRTAETAANLGVTGSMDAADLLNKRAVQWRQADEEALQKTEKLRKDSEIQFLQDPGGYIKAQFYMENTAQEAQNAIDRKTQIAQSIVTMQSLTQQAAQTYNAIKQTDTTASIEAALKAAGAQTQIGINQMKAANAGVAIEALETLNRMDSQQLSNMSVANTALQQERQAKNAAAQLAMSQQSLAIHVSEFNERMEQKRATKEEMDTAGQLLTEGLSIIGKSDGTKLPSSMVPMFMKTPQGQEAYTRAVQSRLVGHPVIAPSLGELTRIVGRDGAPLMPQQTAVRNLLGTSFATASDPVEAKKYGVNVSDPKNLQDVQGAAAQIALKQAQEYLKNIKPGDKANPYAAPPYNTVMEIPGVQNSPLYQKVLKPQHLAGGIQDLDPNNLIASVVSGIKSNQITHAEGAAGISTIFNAIVEKNRINNNYVGMHLPNQDAYRTMIMTPAGIPKMRNLTSLPDINVLLDNQLRGDKGLFISNPRPASGF